MSGHHGPTLLDWFIFEQFGFEGTLILAGIGMAACIGGVGIWAAIKSRRRGR